MAKLRRRDRAVRRPSLSAEAPAVSGEPGRLEGPDRPPGRLITRGAELVVLAEELYLRLFVLALVILVTSISSLRLSLLAAGLNAAGYVAGTVVGGEAIIRGGQAGILAGAVGFVAYTLVGSFVCEAFARFVLGFACLERVTSTGEPRRVSSIVLDDAAAARDADGAGPAGGGEVQLRRAAPLRSTVTAPAGSPLTPRQLEVALLIRDGLNQSEAAASLGISRRQVERLLGEARERAGASTTSHLVAMLVNAGLAP